MVLAAALGGCTAAPGPAPSPSSPAPAATQPKSPTPSEDPQSTSGAVDSYLAWLKASRTPDIDAACAALAPDLANRMIAELNATAPIRVGSCEEMIAATAELYRAVGDDPAVDIAVQQETATDATLFVTYRASGDCGTVVMKRQGTSWILTGDTKECAQ